ncbi:MAG: zinc-ribbon domain-containing protein [Sphingomonas sp.]|uniref:zinc-ribbon domain-containing protein n=1 Tax=Sphingomonas sp. TaxID=28214 RepID=UPI0025F9404C|nr:zinc-ribbon domain-containing protein [Sphingomonas sp.]MBX9881521.1 zinc-ribbon domain-containing protein [Sphingomonas sp.]
MILECSECQTRYLVPDSAIGPEGRTVRCANCKHSWFQEGASIEALTAGIGAIAAPPPSVPAPSPTPAARVEAEPAPVADAPTTPDTAEYDAFGYQPPFRPRRNPARRYTIAAVATSLVLVGGIAALSATGSQGLAAQLGLVTPAATPLLVQADPIRREAQRNGSELFAVSGRIVNPSSRPQRVPDILAELRDSHRRVVFSWTIEPEQRLLRPGASLRFNSAQLDVPSNSRDLRFSFARARMS